MLTEDRTKTGVLDYYARPAAMTSAGDHAPRFARLPHEVADLVGVVQGLLLHQDVAPAYGVTLTEEQLSTAHLRPAEQMLDALFALDDRPLTGARPLDRRLVGNCRHF